MYQAYLCWRCNWQWRMTRMGPVPRVMLMVGMALMGAALAQLFIYWLMP